MKLTIQKKIKTPKGVLFFLILTILLLYISHSLYVWAYSESTENAYVDGNITFISPEVNGIIDQINFLENQKVNKDQVLIKIKDVDYKARHEQAISELQAGKINLNVIDNKIKLAELNLKNSIREYERVSSLTQNNFSSKQVYEKAELDRSKAQVELTTLNSEKQLAQLQLQQLEDGLQIAENNYNNTLIKAPFDGIVTSSSARISGYARAGAPLLALVPLDNYHIKANFKETQISHFKPGMEATINFDAFAGENFVGKIKSIYPATGAKFTLIPTDNATGNFTKIVQRVPVLIELEIPEKYKNKIGIGYSAKVHIRIDK